MYKSSRIKIACHIRRPTIDRYTPRDLCVEKFLSYIAAALRILISQREAIILVECNLRRLAAATTASAAEIDVEVLLVAAGRIDGVDVLVYTQGIECLAAFFIGRITNHKRSELRPR